MKKAYRKSRWIKANLRKSRGAFPLFNSPRTVPHWTTRLSKSPKKVTSQEKPRVHIGVIGHINHNKRTLTEAIKMTMSKGLTPDEQKTLYLAEAIKITRSKGE